MTRVLFVCIQNAGRSQMAHSLLERAARETGAPLEARSAGSAPAAHVHPEVEEALAELGLDTGGRTPHKLDRADAEWADVVVTMGCGDACPYIPGKRYLDWELQDPHGAGLDAVRQIRDDIAARIDALAAELAGAAG